LPLAANAIETRRNVFIAPFRSSWNGGPDHSEIPDHARIKSGGRHIDEFPRTMRDKTDPALTTGVFLYGGPLKIHFGHVMVDSIIRLWAFDKTRHHGVIFPILRNKKPIPNWFYDIIGLFGVPKERVFLVSKKHIFEEVDFAVPGSRLAEGPTKEYLEYL